ncbi:MAG: phage portal protein, partial [Sporomusa sp.]
MSKKNRSKQKARMPTPPATSNTRKAPPRLSPGKIEVGRKVLQVLNTGYSESGASHSKGSMLGWNPVSSSPNSDINANRPELVSRSRSLYMGGNPLATSAINTSRTNIIGAGLKLKPKIDAEALGINKEEAAKKGREIKRKFALWANSRLCDIAQRNNFYDMQDILFVGCLLNGDSWAAIKWRKPMPGMRFALRLQLFESDRVCNPDSYEVAGIAPGNVITRNQKNGNRIIN